MDEKDFNNEPVTEEDYDLFYGFVDSVFEEKKQHEQDKAAEKEPSLSISEPEWTAEPFEEFIVGVPQPDNGKYYSLNIVSPDGAALPGDIHPNHYGTISGIITSITLCAAFLFTVYFLASDPEPEVVSNTHLDKLAQSITAVENKVESVNAMESQMKAMVTQLTVLNSTVSTQRDTQETRAITTQAQIVNTLESQVEKMAMQLKHLNSTIDSPLSRNKIVSNGAWLINVASFRSKKRAQTLLKEIQSIHLPVDIFAITIKGEKWVRVRIPSFNSRLEAQAFMLDLAKLMPNNNSWVGRR